MKDFYLLQVVLSSSSGEYRAGFAGENRPTSGVSDVFVKLQVATFEVKNNRDVKYEHRLTKYNSAT